MLQFGLVLAIAVGTMALFLALSEVWKPGRSHLRRRLAGEVSTPKVRIPSVELYKDSPEWSADEPALDLARERAIVKRLRMKNEGLRHFLREAGFPMEPRQLIAFILSGAIILSGLTGVALGGILGISAGVLALILPWVVLNVRRNLRRERYVKQLANSFELMARVLKSGQPVQEAFRAAVAASGEPLATEFGRCQHQIEHGIRPQDAFDELSARSSILELRIFVIAMTVQRQTGGSLSDVLDRLAIIVRSRLKLKQKLRALTAEGRMQSNTLLALPVITFFIMYFLNRPYAESLLTQWRLLVATAACMGVGVLWIRNIMKFEG